ncbi:hypothetical protein B5C34_05190 [Pacificimonas flava]|uniref:Uncharacterized protein n=2 Tax=Pacificimonas TaxID=1960290 RepID=A0A219B466_9SPHN|nr:MULTISPECIES: hypothetical protein [Pacificimonas]MBZ6377387.1 hypothetical protein [Pacificimonas aurantium]OWV32906.1 hypothetical protein B5C34_05190 [Pacificimonas flava]
MSAAIALLTLRPRDPSTGAVTPICIAAGGARDPYPQGDPPTWAGLAEVPEIGAELSYDSQRLGGEMAPRQFTAVWTPGDAARTALARDLYWPGAEAVLERRVEGVSGAATRILTGRVTAESWRDGQLSLTIADRVADLAVPLIGTSFSGTGDLEGDEGAEGRLKRRSFGTVHNVELLPLIAAENLYEAGDPARPLQAFGEIRDRGYPADAAKIQEVSWQGSMAATLAALRAVDLGEGTTHLGAAAPSIACVKWWTRPSGPLTADIEGETEGGFAETAAEIAAQLIAAGGGPALAAGTLAAATAARPGAAGLHVGKAATVAEILQLLLSGVSLFWRVTPDGEIELGEWTFGAPEAAFSSEGYERLQTFAPVAAVDLGYRQNYRVHSGGEIVDAAAQRFVGPFDETREYRRGDIASEEGSLYEYIHPEPAAGTSLDDAARWKEVLLAETGLRFRGVWSSANIAYLTNDFVTHENKSWRAKADHVSGPSLAPPNGTYWELVLEGGTTPITFDASPPVISLSLDELGQPIDPLPRYSVLKVFQGEEEITGDASLSALVDTNCDAAIFGTTFRLDDIDTGDTEGSMQALLYARGQTREVRIDWVGARHGEKGDEGTSPFRITADPPVILIEADENGYPVSGSLPALTTLTAKRGSEDITASASYSAVQGAGCVADEADETLSVISVSAESGSISILVSHQGESDRFFVPFRVVKKGEAGDDGGETRFAYKRSTSPDPAKPGSTTSWPPSGWVSDPALASGLGPLFIVAGERAQGGSFYVTVKPVLHEPLPYDAAFVAVNLGFGTSSIIEFALAAGESRTVYAQASLPTPTGSGGFSCEIEYGEINGAWTADAGETETYSSGSPAVATHTLIITNSSSVTKSFRIRGTILRSNTGTGPVNQAESQLRV